MKPTENRIKPPLTFHTWLAVFLMCAGAAMVGALAVGVV